MTGELIVRRLAQSDLRDAFDCGHAGLNEFFKTRARQNQALGMSVTVLALLDVTIVGFVTVATATVDPDDLSFVLRKTPKSPVPVLLLARMGTAPSTRKPGESLRVAARLLREGVFPRACQLKEVSSPSALAGLSSRSQGPTCLSRAKQCRSCEV